MENKSHIALHVEGMTCDACARHVTEALRSLPGVEKVEVGNWQSGHATVLADASVTDKNLAETVRIAGYRAIVRERKLDHPGQVNFSRDSTEYDLMVIGGGSAGFAAAIKASELGARVAIVESGTIGGTCVNVGCVPSKTLIRAAEHCYVTSNDNFQGVTACSPPLDWRGIIQQKDELVASLRKGKYSDVAQSYPNISILHGEARLTGKRALEVNGRVYTPGKILIATGSSPWAPPIPGLTDYLDSTAALSIPTLPKSMIVIGAGAIGLELAQMFARFGVKVIVLEVLPRIAALEEPEISLALTDYLQREKIDIRAGVKVDRVEKKDGEYSVTIEEYGKKELITGEQLLVAAGRRARTAHLNLEAAEVQVGKRGEIHVNQHLQTSNPDIYAAGDVIGDPMFVYVTAYAGALAAENALTDARRVYNLSAVPRVTFTDPQIASVGLTESHAREQGYNVKTSIIHARDVPRALAARDPRGLIKLVAENDTGKLLGAHVLAVEAGDVIQEATLTIRFGLTYKDIVETFHPYLTWVEGIKLAAITFEKDVHQLSCCAA